MTNLQPAIDYFGSQVAIAKALGINPMAITQWKKRGIPPMRAIELANASQGAFMPSDILPALSGFNSASR
jgi:DNA-binding transcriptional regulator YdaS (Cro superfamily)